MVGGVIGGLFVADRLIGDLQAALVVQLVCDCGFQGPGEALLAVRAFQGKGHAGLLALLYLGGPQGLMKAPGPAVQGVLPVVLVQCILLAVHGEPGAANAVAKASDGGALKVFAQILLQSVVAQNHVPGFAVPVGGNQAEDAAAVVAYGDSQRPLGEDVGMNLPAVRKTAEAFDLHSHGLSLPCILSLPS